MPHVTRAQWGARPPKSAGIHQPMNSILGHWEGPRMGVFPHASCPSKVRGIQNFHMDGRGWADIAYSGMVCPHGYLFECRGPNIRTAANGTNPANDKFHALCYLSGDGDPFTDEAKLAFGEGFAWLGGHAGGLAGHRDVRPTTCPGDVVEAWIKAGAPMPGPVTPPQPPTPQPAPACPAVFEFMAYDPGLSSGVNVNGPGTGATASDGVVITAPKAGAAPHVMVRSAKTGEVLASFYAYAQDMTAGVNVALGDVDGDGLLEIVTAPGAGGGPHLRVFGFDGAEKGAGWAYRSDMALGVDVGMAGPGLIVVGAGPGGGPHVRVIDYAAIKH